MMMIKKKQLLTNENTWIDRGVVPSLHRTGAITQYILGKKEQIFWLSLGHMDTAKSLLSKHHFFPYTINWSTISHGILYFLEILLYLKLILLPKYPNT